MPLGVLSAPVSEVLKWHSVREPPPANSDPLQHPIASQLMQHQLCVYKPGLLNLVWNDAPHEVRLCVVEIVEQLC